MRVYFYEDDIAKVEVSISRYNFALPFAEGKSVLDIGCGARKGPLILSEKAKKIIATDISFQAIEYCKENYRKNNVSYIVSDAVRLPFREGFFDIVSSFEVIEHLNDYLEYLREAKRVLKEKGSFIVSTPNREVVSPGGNLTNPDHVREFDLEQFSRILGDFFQDFVVYGQHASQRTKQLEKIRLDNLKTIDRMPKALRKLYPKGFKESTLRFCHYLSAILCKGIDSKKITQNDFFFTKEDLKTARYFLAVCKK
ncbi:MAG: class I SAM-dependent methyltransferase [Candidatus Omnitrophica bacterium]|nr:class I SAM-dependent methyltransferase [Candidatus Omnitrophota bacterium]